MHCKVLCVCAFVVMRVAVHIRTILKQSATIDVHGVPLLGSVLESLWLNQYKTSVSNVSFQVK